MLVAASFLTRLHIPATATGAEVGASVRWFPLVGALLGAAAAGAAWLLGDRLAMPATLTAAIIVALGAWITGAIHLDGLADTVDGFGGGRTRDEVLRIMRDPTIGSFGATALWLVLTIKVFSMAELLHRDAALPFLIAAPTLSRWTVVALAAWLPYARAEGGLGQAVSDVRSLGGLLVSTAIATLISIVALRLSAIVPMAAVIFTTLCLAHAARRRIGGVTGDVFGASVELAESAVLFTAVAITGGGS